MSLLRVDVFKRLVRQVVVGALLIGGAVGCNGREAGTVAVAGTPVVIGTAVDLRPQPSATPALVGTADASVMPDRPREEQWFGVTPPTGNRVVGGAGALPDGPTRQIALGGVADWVVGAPIDDGVLWVVVLTDGRVSAQWVQGNVTRPVVLNVSQVAVGQPPVLRVDGNTAELWTPAGDYSTDAPGVGLPFGATLWVAGDGEVIVNGVGSGVVGLRDGRWVLLNGLAVGYTQPTEAYPHNVLGDAIEGGGLTVLMPPGSADGGAAVFGQWNAPVEAVFEGLGPLTADVDGDSNRIEIVATASDAEGGARLVVYDAQGALLAQSAPIGRGFRWRNVLGVGAFGPNGEIEVVDVVTPHLGGVVSFYRMIGAELVLQSSVSGYTSHVIGSRNLDMAAGGDFDGDGRLEVLLPSQDLTRLGAVQHQAQGAVVIWEIALPDRMVSNVATVALPDGGLAVAVGTADGTLTIWGGP